MPEQNDAQDEVIIDWKRIKNFFKGSKDQSPGELKKFWKNIKTYQVLFLVLIPLILAVVFRTYPISLPITDEWATETVYNNIKNQMAAQISQEFPNLPDDRKTLLLNERFNEVLQENHDQINIEIEQASQYFKSQFQNEWGHTYVLDIDPYHHVRQATYLIEKGHPGNVEIDGKFYDTQKYAPKGVEIPRDMLMYSILVIYWILSIVQIWAHEQTVFIAAYYSSVVIASLAIIPAFFIGRRIAGNLGGFMSAMMLATAAQFISRTSAGVPETDGFNVLLPLMITWLFIESFEASSWRNKIILSSLAGLFIGIFSFAWEGWWYIFVIIVATTLAYLAYHVAIKVLAHRKKGFMEAWKSGPARESLGMLVIFIIASGVFVSIFSGPVTFFDAPLNALAPKQAIGKHVAETDIFPKIHTTVAELNEADIGDIISEMGGRFYYILALVGITLILIREEKRLWRSIGLLVGSLVWYAILHTDSVFSLIGRHYLLYVILISIPPVLIMFLVRTEKLSPYKRSLLLLIWYVATIYATLNGIRFLLLLIPAFVVAFGTCIGILYEYVQSYLDKEVSSNVMRKAISAVLILCALTLLISPVVTAHKSGMYQVPLINKSWVTSLQMIKADSKPDAIINSWWDYGHWFITVANRSATFDGSVQKGSHAYWIGRSFLTDDEDVTVGILRMLDCSANDAYEMLLPIIDDGPKTIDVINHIIVLDKDQAREYLISSGIRAEEADAVLTKTHCNPPEDYYIASDDMIGKSGVWAHFGSWNFTKADMYLNVNKLSQSEGVALLQEKYGLAAEEAARVYGEIQTTDADRWIAPWPSFAGASSCEMTETDVLSCDSGIEVNLVTGEAGVRGPDGTLYRPNRVVIPKSDGSYLKKDFTGNLIESRNGMKVGITVVRDGSNWITIQSDPALAGSMFTKLYWLEGHGLKHFKLLTHQTSFNGNEIYVWKVNWEGTENNILQGLGPVESSSPSDAEDATPVSPVVNSTVEVTV